MENRLEKLACYCALNKIFGYKPKVAIKLIKHFEDIRSIFSTDRETLTRVVGFSHDLCKIDKALVETCIKELERLGRNGCSFISLESPGYPPLLKECEDAPVFLYLRGVDSPEQIFHKPSLAIVGTRDMSSYGRDWCRNIVETLACSETRPLIVSGLALGVDATAHKAALDSGLPTAGVMATGIEDVYPFCHGLLADRIAGASGSCLLTDYPPGTRPTPINFLRRNRIIAGICQATILIESRKKGGGILTARLAYSYNRDVYALPGRADDMQSAGCNILIQEKVAEPAFDPEELAKKLGLRLEARQIKRPLKTIISETYKEADATTVKRLRVIAETIQKIREISVEDISRLTGIPYADAVSLVSTLESDGIISTDVMLRCSYTGK